MNRGRPGEADPTGPLAPAFARVLCPRSEARTAEAERECNRPAGGAEAITKRHGPGAGAYRGRGGETAVPDASTMSPGSSAAGGRGLERNRGRPDAANAGRPLTMTHLEEHVDGYV